MPFAAGRSRGCRKGSRLENEPEVHTSQVGSGDGPPTHHPIPFSQPIHRSETFPPYKRCPRWREVDQHPHRTAPCTPTPHPPTSPEAQRGLGLTRSGPSLPPSLPTTRCWAAGAPGRSSCCAARCTAGTATAPVPPCPPPPGRGPRRPLGHIGNGLWDAPRGRDGSSTKRNGSSTQKGMEKRIQAWHHSVTIIQGNYSFTPKQACKRLLSLPLPLH